MKTKKRFYLGILLSLALVLGLMSGMSMTAYAMPADSWETYTLIVMGGKEEFTINQNFQLGSEVTATIENGMVLRREHQ